MIRIRSVTDGLPSAPFLTTHYFTTSSDVLAADCYAAVGAFWEAMSVAINDNATVSVDPVVYVIDPDTGDTTGTFIQSTALSYPGTNTGHAVPAGVSPILQLRTGVYVAGREIRGRMFLPGMTEDQFASGSGTLQETSRAYLADIGQQLIETELGWCVWSRKNGQATLIGLTGVAQSAGMIRSRRP